MSQHKHLLDLIAENSEIFYENAPCGFVFTAPDGVILKANKIFFEWSGYKEEDFLENLRFQDILSTGSRIHYETNFRPLLQIQGTLNEIAIDFLIKDGGYFPALMNSTAVKDLKDNVLFICSSLFNISDRRLYEKQLIETKFRAEKIADRLDFLEKAGQIFRGAKNLKESITEVSETACTKFCNACSVDMYRDNKFLRIAEVNSFNGKKLPEFTSDHLVSKPILVPNGELSFPDLEPESVLMVPIKDKGEVIGLWTAYMLEFGQVFTHDDLEVLVEIGTRAVEFIKVSLLQEERDREMNEKLENLKQLEEEKEIREKFVATLTHDLRSPLTAVKMCAQSILRKIDDAEVIQSLTVRVINNVNRIDHMIQNLLDANTIRAGGKLELEMNLCDLIYEIKEAVLDLSTIHGNRFIYEGPNQLEGYWNRMSIRRIIENLCNNAVKYGANNTPIIIKVGINQEKTIITVNNRGDLIGPEDQKTLFQPYQRTDSARKSSQKGWGLGLSLVRAVSEAHGGRVEVSSTNKEGTTFSVILPIRKV